MRLNKELQTRRAILRALGAVGAAAALPGSLLAPGSRASAADRAGDSKALALARCAERWIAAARIPTSFGVTWPMNPENGQGGNGISLYSGVTGIVLFYLELYEATGEMAYLREALAGADDLIARNDLAVAEPDFRGLYTGLAGHVFLFGEIGKALDSRRHTQQAREYVTRLRDLARPAGQGVEWNEYTDIVYGNAGIGLVLMYAQGVLGSDEALPLARRAGMRLLEVGIPADGGLRWEMKPGFARYMPNFSHGTAGVGYFLAALHEATGEQQFLDAALAAARHVLAVAKTEDGQCLIMHDDPEGKELYYLGWCHGPVGTTRLFYQLARITRDPAWDEWVRRGAETLIRSGIPEKRSEGFWNNVGACCGDAAVARYFMDLHEVYGDKRYFQFSHRMLEEVYRRCDKDAQGCKWLLVEMRREPQNISAQTGYMQGAAGIGSVLLRMDGVERGRKPIVWPDSPFTPA